MLFFGTANIDDFDKTPKKYTIEELQDLRRVDGIVEPVFTQDCFPRTLQKKGVTKNCFERANLGNDTYCSSSEIKMIKEYYKKGQDKDPLNNGSGNLLIDLIFLYNKKGQRLTETQF